MKKPSKKHILHASKGGVCFQTNKQDIQCVVLAKLGFSAIYIQVKTGLTPGQISYRLKRSNVKLADYRYGRSQAGKSVASKICKTSVRNLASILSRELKVNVIVNGRGALQLK